MYLKYVNTVYFVFKYKIHFEFASNTITSHVFQIRIWNTYIWNTLQLCWCDVKPYSTYLTATYIRLHKLWLECLYQVGISFWPLYLTWYGFTVFSHVGKWPVWHVYLTWYRFNPLDDWRLRCWLCEQGNQCFKEARYAEAVEYYTKALGLDGDYAVLYANRAMALLKQEKWVWTFLSEIFLIMFGYPTRGKTRSPKWSDMC